MTRLTALFKLNGPVDDAQRRRFAPSRWPDWTAADGHPEFERRRKRGGVVGSILFVVFLYGLLEDAAQAHASTLFRALIVFIVIVYAAGYMYGVIRGVRLGHRQRVYLVIVMILLGSLPALLTGRPGDLTYLTYTVSVAVMLLPLRVSRLIVIALALVEVLAMWWVDGSVTWSLVLVLLGVGLGMSAFFALIYTIEELRGARDEIKTLAVAEERERFARDLHDILGHSLTTITVKAGLARRILESGADLPAARAEIADVEELGRQALADVRSTVSNYRIASLPAEIAGARMSLQAAQITPDLPRAVDNVDAGLQEVFGYVVREAVTNVIRHSHADRCEVRLGDRWVEVLDDGAANGAGHDLGNGLRGLRERLSAVGGELTAEPRSSGGFRVLATVPATES